ncbi:helix-turn-helix transcriptional regulator [Dactylosporangium roseum]|uniref:Helix-turn-helix transcriptional regulator n=1 Tax=Dactylosporangium roseum TaxID=47989 RepID=A0ABY5YWI0_9ACTN|nr:helix-turn-helix transcriptional regulator [Dactylosporangium roseum]UWZ34100.1 helix-turn-helix transcriptional regulator [Dactylosporangium roseum]
MTTMTLAAKLDRLFRTVHPAGRAEYTYEEVASAIRERGVMISHTYIWQLRKGNRDNPTKRHLEALAEFFGVNPAYFLDDDAARRIDDQLELLAALRDNAVRTVALRAAGLSGPSLEAIHGMIEHARRIEGLPPT